MRNLSREYFERGIVSKAMFHSRLTFIGIILLQAWPNEGIFQNKTSQWTSMYYHRIPITILEAAMILKYWP